MPWNESHAQTNLASALYRTCSISLTEKSDNDTVILS